MSIRPQYTIHDPPPLPLLLLGIGKAIRKGSKQQRREQGAALSPALGLLYVCVRTTRREKGSLPSLQTIILHYSSIYVLLYNLLLMLLLLQCTAVLDTVPRTTK